MQVDMGKLVPEFREKVELVLITLRELGLEFRPFYGLRGTVEQGALWRQSRTSQEVKFAIDTLRKHGALYLANALEKAGPRSGRWATNALPGNSFHQWGEAVDCMLIRDGRAVWSDIEAYKQYRDVGEQLGLYRGPMNDWVHLQNRPESAPSKIYSLLQINDEMLRRGL